MRLEEQRLIECRFLISAINSSGFNDKYKENMRRIIVSNYRREYITDTCIYSQSEQDRLRNDFDIIFPIKRK